MKWNNIDYKHYMLRYRTSETFNLYAYYQKNPKKPRWNMSINNGSEFTKEEVFKELKIIKNEIPEQFLFIQIINITMHEVEYN